MADRAEYFKNYQEKRKRVSASYSSDEFNRIDELSKALNTKPATIVRKLSLVALEGGHLQSTDKDEDTKELIFLLSNIANNLNQIARHSNRVRKVMDEEAVLKNLRDLSEYFKPKRLGD